MTTVPSMKIFAKYSAPKLMAGLTLRRLRAPFLAQQRTTRRARILRLPALFKARKDWIWRRPPWEHSAALRLLSWTFGCRRVGMESKQPNDYGRRTPNCRWSSAPLIRITHGRTWLGGWAA